MECGTTCLAMVFKYYGYHDARSFLTEKAEVDVEGIDLYTISDLAESFGFDTDGYQMDYEYLQKVDLPVIAHYEGNHFVVVYRMDAHKVWIADPAIGKYTLTKDEFVSKWNGIVLALTPTEELFKSNAYTEEVEAQRDRKKSLFSEFYLSSIRGSKKVIRDILLSTLFLQFLGLAIPFFTQGIIDKVLVSNNTKLLYAILIGMISVFLCQVVLTYGRNVLLAQFKVSFERAFFSKFFNHFIRLKQSYFDRHKREDFVNRFQENMKIRQALNPAILEALIDFLFVVTYIMILVAYNVKLGLLSLGFVVVYTFLSVIFFPRLKNLENQIFAENVKTMGSFLDTLLGIQSVKLLGIEKLKYWKWRNQYTLNLNKVLLTQKTYIRLSTLLSSVYYIGQAAVYWVGAYLTFEGQMTIGQYIAFITIFMIVFNSITNISRLSFLFTELSVSYNRVNDVLEQEVADSIKLGQSAIKGPATICFEAFSFKYRQRDEKNILNGINLTITAGQKIGVVGRNGSGKSTLIKVLSGLYEQYEGRITIGGLELSQILKSDLRKKIAVIPQDIFLFDGTIKENIQFGNPNATTEEVVMAAKQADIHDFIKSQYLGYNQKVGENGIKLSGGQQLKIAFARLFVANPEIIILDEASSALDVETEKRIMGNVYEKYHDKTIIAIAHRLHTLRNADQIIVIDHGEIIEQGKHDALMKEEGLYYQFNNTYVNF